MPRKIKEINMQECGGKSAKNATNSLKWKVSWVSSDFETMHWTVLAQATKEMLPQKALTFGA